MIERVLGQDGLLRWHRRLAPWPISLLVAHAVFITVGYAQAARAGLWHEAGVLLTRYPDVLIATIGLGIMCLIGVISHPRDPAAGCSRETWWLVHLYMYLALALSFAHVIVLGPSFVGHPLTRVVWSVAWAATAGLVLCLPVRPAGRAQHAPPAGGGRGAAGGPGRGVGHLRRAAAGRLPVAGGAVHAAGAFSPGPVVAGAPVLPVGPAAAALPAPDRQGGGRPLGLAGLAAPGHAGHGGGAIRGVHPSRAGAARGPCWWPRGSG